MDRSSRLEEISTSIAMLENIYAATNNTGIINYNGVLKVTVRLARLLCSLDGDNEITSEHDEETIVIMN